MQNHFNGILIRVTGSGNLLTKLLSLSETVTQTLVPLVLLANNDNRPIILANFTQDKAALEIKTTEMNETFRISHITIFTKPVASARPQ